MKTLILAAGHFGKDLRDRISQGKEPRLDVYEIAAKLNADVVDFSDVEASNQKSVKLASKALGLSAGVATIGYNKRHQYDAILTTGEDIGLPLAALLKTSRAKCSHTMIVHTLFPRKKRIFFGPFFNVRSRIDHILAYASSEQRLMVDELGIDADRIQLIYYHADELFFTPNKDITPEPDLLCAAGQLLRDYDCLIDAVRELPVRLQVAAGSPWINKKLTPGAALPENVKWSKLNRYDLRTLYSTAAIAVVPIKQNEYQTGIATILEMMAMGKCIICTRTRGQTDTIVDGETGVYVPPGDSGALRSTIERLLANPDEVARLGAAARAFIEKNAGLNLFVDKICEAVKSANERKHLN